MKRRILPFAFAGAIGFVVDAGVLFLAAPFVGAFGGRLVSFFAAVLTTWAINRRFAFADKSSSVRPAAEFARYFGAMLPGAAVNWAVFALAVALLPSSPAELTLGVAAGSLTGMATNLVAADRLAFKGRS